MPVIPIYVDIWHSNATGVYSGVVANGNGNSDDSRNLNNTGLRGLQETNKMGIVQFKTIFPGHYGGRTNKLHRFLHFVDCRRMNQSNPCSHTTTTMPALPTRTIPCQVSSQVGQLFFDQSLQADVETYEPYSSNTQALTSNAQCMILASEANTSDRMMEYVLLGDCVTDRILGWIRIGIDPTETRNAGATPTYYRVGGLQAGVSGFMGPEGGDSTMTVSLTSGSSPAVQG